MSMEFKIKEGLGNHGYKFTIGTISNSLDLAEDLKLIKSSILYADEIELIGMAEYGIKPSKLSLTLRI